MSMQAYARYEACELNPNSPMLMQGKVQALYAADQQWYNATVEAVTVALTVNLKVHFNDSMSLNYIRTLVLMQGKVQALYAADQQWYNATVEAVTVTGNLVVNYDGYDERAEVRKERKLV